ncbi:hypothetical protein BP6252_09850 [Coleophoma cylindrospora]|uniref:DNA replication ATP-dependent helicase/nuclease n=1 Tax=Coleophoma cylindrospora TaxID=1849047 RepID=A0A3D8QWS0_9HELO|nr:hypothetical protein BP6252_09850 [Coleophoma cylindrospora]
MSSPAPKDASTKQRQWQRNKSYQGPQAPTAHPNSKPLQEKPPIPISTNTKNKLNAFQFSEQQDQNGSEAKQEVISLLSSPEKENDSLLESPRQRNARARQDSDANSRLGTTPSAKKEIPTTPAGRLALPDLIGMGDVRRAVQDISPDDRIMWDCNKDIPSSASSIGGIRRAKKRARSSSPTSSPAHASGRFHAKGDNLINQQMDPGCELWGRYSLTTSNNPTQGNAVSSLAHIMHTSSPQPLKGGTTPRLGTGFRRANSCGTAFPKRRRVGGYNGEADNLFSELATIGPSKLSVLIEKVQEGLTRPGQPKCDSEQSSSSPMQTSMQSVRSEGSSPIRRKTGTERLTPGNFDLDAISKTIDADCSVLPETSDGHESSDYGEFDDEFGDEFLDTVDLEATESKNVNLAPPRAHEDPPHNSWLQSALTTVSSPTKPAALPNSSDSLDGDDDEFGELGDDLLAAADFEHVMSQYDTQAAPEIKRRENQYQRSKLADSAAHSDDEFGNDFDDVDLAAVEAEATQSAQKTSRGLLSSVPKQAIQRHLVKTVLDNEYISHNRRQSAEKILLLETENSKSLRTVHLRDTWFDTPVTKGAFVHIIGSFESGGRCVIDDDRNILILHPDHLVSATVVADSFGCTRRAVLQDRVKATSDSSAPLVYGAILHEIFQAAMLANRWDTQWLTELISTIAQKHLEELYTISIQVPHAIQYLQSKMPELQSWAEVFVSSQPKPQAIVQAGNGATAVMCISKLLEVEEHVWSPMYGLKGNIDATVQVTMQDNKGQRTLTVPFEVKTGKNPSPAHRAQTALYNLLMSDRYDIEIAYGILYYMETSETIRIPAIRHELRHMIMQRNELACFVRDRHTKLPPMLKKESLCGRCYAKVPCFIYHKLADDGNGETSGMKGKFDEIVRHLTSRHKEFFLKWDNLLTKEEKESLKFRRELWTMLSTEREKLGRCFANVAIEEGSAFEDKNSPKINRYQYTLIKKSHPIGFSFLESQIIVGEPIVISDEKGHFALANGYVTKVRRERITVAVDRRLHNARIRRSGFDEEDNQVFASIMEVAPEGSTAEQSSGKIVEEPVLYRLDKDEFSNGMATVRNNLIQVMADGPFGSREIRSLVVDMIEPRFKPQSTAYVLKDRASINIDQTRAIQKVMSAQDYALVLGMPGTGKTTTIAHIIRALVSQGKSVLLTSYTHSAVDNILLKLKEDEIRILRLGAPAKIHPEVQKFAGLAVTPKDTFEEIRSAWNDSPVVATTCLSINHPLFNERTFDYCIVDEASQITLPVCLGPIRMARTFILVGDHNQLPPLVQNEEARAGGLDISLFKLLSDSHPSSVVYLEHQYRMCADVMALSNYLIYSGRLKCGSQEVANSRLVIPDMGGLTNHHHTVATLSRTQKTICAGPLPSKCWIRDLLDPNTKVSFINTDTLLPEAREQAQGNRIVNPTEAAICVQLVKSLLSVGVPATTIGVMTHYRSQLELLKGGLRRHKDVEMHTADRFQGRDKEVIILSLVRSNEAKSIGELLKDWRRINVAFTRAKTKLLVIGSRETLKGNEGNEEMVSKFVRLMEKKHWIYDLPKSALEDHFFDDTASQVTASMVSRPSGTQWKPIHMEIAKPDPIIALNEKRGKKQHQPKRLQAGEKAILQGRPVLGNIFAELTGN